MGAYIIKRLLWAIPTLLGATTIIFLLMRVLPGDIAMMIVGGEGSAVVDPAKLEAVREKLGLNLPLWKQYLDWMWGAIRFDFGNSLWTQNPVWTEIGVRIPYTLTLVALSITLSVIFSIPIGVLSALKQDTWVDYSLRSFLILGLSMPSFWFGMLLLMFTVSVFQWSPPLDYAPVHKDPITALQQLFLPALALGYRSAAVSARMMRSSMLEVMREDYVRTAWAKGLRERVVVFTHAARNAILPVVTLFALEIILIFSTAVVIEKIFNIPGLGRLLVDSITRRDVNMVQGLVTFTVAFVLGVNLLVDLVYAKLDPRIRFR
jgi:peptide/nickel transport system permease protein